MKTFSLKTTENYPINISLFEPKISNQKLLLINSATGVKQQTYWKFAQYFAKEGFTVVTYDYYGIGLSKPKNLKKCNATMRTWGSVDYKTLTGFIQEKYPEYQKFCLGHSVGALILGMNEESDIFEKFVFVTTQKAFVGNLNLKTKVASYFGFGLVQPFLTPIFGYFPAQLFGIGESLPKGSAYDWRTLILNKKSTNRLLEKTTDFSKKLTQKTLVISAEDDSWVTEKGMNTLLSETYPNLQPQFRHLKISESEKGEIGHINFFRGYNQNLWKIVLEFVLAP
ncbi:MAG: alpha/beta hydrolase [Cloacibacterium sp.]|nr:alpha/beta hydrolase [Cloacibacterium sp.]